MPRKRALKLEVADGIRKVRLGAYRKTGDKAETEWFDRNRLGTEPYARWCGRTAGVTPPPTRILPILSIPPNSVSFSQFVAGITTIQEVEGRILSRKSTSCYRDQRAFP